MLFIFDKFLQKIFFFLHKTMHHLKPTKQQAYCITILVLSIVHLLLSLLVAFAYSKKDAVVFAFAVVSCAVNLVILILAAITLHNLPKPMNKN